MSAKKKRPKLDPQTVAAIDAIYARLPTVACKRLCGGACGPLTLSPFEARRLQLATHRKPKTLPMVEGDPASLRCVYLTPDEDGCTAYAVRPLICRVWGVLKRLSCPHGCEPDRWLDDFDFFEIALAVEQLGGGKLLHTGPSGLEDRGEAYGQISRAGLVPRNRDVVADDAERVRSLRAIYGGRIIATVPTLPGAEPGLVDIDTLDKPEDDER